MSEALDINSELDSTKAADDFQRPGDLTDNLFGKEIPSAYDVPLEDINPIWPRAFQENRLWEFFDRLREEDPVHFNETDQTGRYWSLTRYDDIKAVDIDHKNFFPQHGITLGIPIDAPLPEGALDVDMFIAMDPPKHDVQRKTVSPVVAPSNLANMEPLIRERTIEVLDSLPIGETFDWVDTVSIELTTRMLATLFEFPFEDRRKLTRWSDVSTAVPGRGIIDTEQQRIDELMECLTYFTNLWNERKVNPSTDLISFKCLQPHPLLQPTYCRTTISTTTTVNQSTLNNMLASLLHHLYSWKAILAPFFEPILHFRTRQVRKRDFNGSPVFSISRGLFFRQNSRPESRSVVYS